jgi:aspartyl/asparaginyl-tRNA synthetase
VLPTETSLVDETVTFRARVHNTRPQGKGCFLILRESFYTIQALMFADDSISEGMIKYSSKIPKESMVEITGIVKDPGMPIKT